MYNETDLAAAIRRLAIGAVEYGKPSALCYGTVLSTAPLRVQVDEKLVLGSAQLALSSLVSNFSVEMQVQHETDEAEGHRHTYEGKKEFTTRMILGLSGCTHRSITLEPTIYQAAANSLF